MLSYEAEARRKLTWLLKPFAEIGRDLLSLAETVCREAAEVHDASGRPWRQLCALMFLFEGTRRYRAAHVVADAGLDRECNIIVRSLLEIVMRCRYLCSAVDPTHWPPLPQGVTPEDAVAFYFMAIRPQLDKEAFVAESAAFRASRENDDVPRDAAVVQAVRAQVSMDRDELVADGWEPWLVKNPAKKLPSLRRMATIAGLEHYYTLMYGDAGFSADIHASSAFQAFEIGADGSEATLRATDIRAVVRTVDLALNLLLLLTATVADSMEIEIEASLSDFRKRLDELPDSPMPSD